ncbi:Increased rDNA silencing protein 4 [Talaromyces islandicus]|uniref:Increased rDNA silencing protein 4 n=1 Tax=Talaromyces islandicus TaxID=28573 RepID=A0A0U1LLV1_TALIS|nr:Increased rDNA silencing protein 4 [Talaromyces islandicus]
MSSSRSGGCEEAFTDQKSFAYTLFYYYYYDLRAKTVVRVSAYPTAADDDTLSEYPGPAPDKTTFESTSVTALTWLALDGVSNAFMSGGTGSLVLDGQSTAQRALKNAQEMAALQGANIAFSAHKLQSDSSNVSHNSSKATRAVVSADRTKRAERHSEDDNGSDMPEDGFVTDRIKQFSKTSTPASMRSPNRGGHLAAKDASIPIQAASLAAARSASRTPQSARPTPSVSPIRIHPTGEPKDGIPRTPKVERSPSRISKPLPAPVPVRKPQGVVDSLAKITDEDKYRASSASSTQWSSPTLAVETTRALRSPTVRKVVNDRPSSAVSTHVPVEKPSNPPIPTRKEVQSGRHDRKPAPAVPKPRRTATVTDEEPPKPALPPRTATLSLEDDGHTSSSSAAEEKTNSSRRRVRSTSVSTRSSHNTSSSDQVRVPNHAQGSARPGASDANRMSTAALADAIVASSLASSRAVSPLKVPPPPLPPNRRARSRSLLHPTDMFKGEPQRKTPSPPKGLRQTLRDPSKSDDEEAKRRGGRHLIRHHPHKYHEGDRKRWRQEIPERERKRYEGVWAANKGLCVPPQAVMSQLFPLLPSSVVLSDMVVHLVVRDIWSRSRLPSYTLEGIWNLVDHYGIGLLSREEFVVGLWLIDQSLKGHKIPLKVPDSVWESVRHAPGLKIPSSFE